MDKIQLFLNNLDTKTEVETKNLLDELGFAIEELPVSCLPVDKMLQNYIEAKITEDQLTPVGLEQYKKFHHQPNICVDIFEFKDYFDDFLLFSRYFCGLELYLRTAIWINYKYEHLKSDEERNKLDEEIKQHKQREEYLETLTNVFEPQFIVERWYYHFRPEKLKPGFVERIMNKPQYIAHPDGLFNQLYHKYVDSEWDLLDILWFSQRHNEPKDTTYLKQKKIKQIEEDLPIERLQLKPLTRKVEKKPLTGILQPKPSTSNITSSHLQSLTCPQLKEILKEKGIYKGCSKLRKEELIAKILNL